MLKTVSCLILSTIAIASLFPTKANAQWIPTGKDEDGDVHFVSQKYWTLRSNPDIVIFYSKTPGETNPRGHLTAVNCRMGVITHDVSGDGVNFRVTAHRNKKTLLKSTTSQSIEERKRQSQMVSGNLTLIC